MIYDDYIDYDNVATLDREQLMAVYRKNTADWWEDPEAALDAHVNLIASFDLPIWTLRNLVVATHEDGWFFGHIEQPEADAITQDIVETSLTALAMAIYFSDIEGGDPVYGCQNPDTGERWEWGDDCYAIADRHGWFDNREEDVDDDFDWSDVASPDGYICDGLRIEDVCPDD